MAVAESSCQVFMFTGAQVWRSICFGGGDRKYPEYSGLGCIWQLMGSYVLLGMCQQISLIVNSVRLIRVCHHGELETRMAVLSRR